MRRHPALMLFPVVTLALMLFIAVLFLAPVALQPTGHGYTSGAHWKAVADSMFIVDSTPHQAHHSRQDMSVRPAGMVYFAVMYFVSMFFATFFNVAFYSQILRALKGEEPSIGAGLLFACTKWKSIVLWTLFAGLIGYIIQALERKFGFVGQWILKMIGTVWSIACVFVIPVIVMEEETNPFAVLKKSATTLKQTWGESLIGYAGVSLASGLVTVGSLVFLGAGLALGWLVHSVWLMVAFGLGWLLAMICVGYITSIASQIFRCALYLYATEGNLPQPFTGEMMTMAWKMKKPAQS